MTMNVQDSMVRKLFMMNIWRKQGKNPIDLRSKPEDGQTLGMTVRQSTTSSRERRLSR